MKIAPSIKRDVLLSSIEKAENTESIPLFCTDCGADNTYESDPSRCQVCGTHSLYTAHELTRMVL